MTIVPGTQDPRRRGRRELGAPTVRPRRARRLGVVLAALGVVVATTTSCDPPAMTVTPVVTGLAQPWDIAFTPDGTMLFTQKTGQINALVGGSTVLVGKPTDSIVSGEGGMMGMAVDPEFASNRYIYTCFLSNLPAPSRDVRVVRFTVGPGYTSLSDRADIVTGLPYSSGRHSGCRPRFGAGGHLYVGTGDAAVGTNPQNRQSLGGKVLRVDRNGNGVAGNPGVDDPGSGFLPQIFTYGHRNVQGLALRSDGLMYSVEHGTGCDDEVNLLEAGANYGWDPIPGYNETRPMTDLVKFPDARPAVWSSGCPTIAPSGATFVQGQQWGGYAGGLVAAVLKGSQLKMIQIDYGDKRTVTWQTSAVTDQGRLRSAVVGPDGDLYVAQDANPGKILRVHAGD
jgi:glucose/arabinose dehydrogenase